MDLPSPIIATHFLMHNKYPVNTKRLLKSNYKYKRRPPFQDEDSKCPQQQKVIPNFHQQQQHHSMQHQQQQNNKIFSLIYQFILMLIKLLIYQRATTRQQDKRQHSQEEEFITINNVNSNYAAIHELNTATLATKSCKLLQSKLSNYKVWQQQQQESLQPLPLAPLTHADTHNCHNCSCNGYCLWSLAVARLSNFSSLLSMLLAKLRPAAAARAVAQTTASALSGTSTTTLLTAMTATSTPTAATATSKRCCLSMWHSHKGISVNLLVMTLFIALLSLTSSIRGVAGGACWKSALDNGKCSEIFSMNITRSDCCRISSEFSYTERQLTSVEFFFATTIGGGMECAPCVESCKSVKCGVNKKCVKRKGRPKCICAPDCGAAKRRKQQQRLLMRQYGARRDIRSLSSEIKHNYNLELNQFSLLLSQQQQHHSAAEALENQRNMQILQSQSQQPAKQQQQQRRRIIIANAEPTPAAKRRIQILSNADSGGGRNKHPRRMESEGRRRQLDKNNNRRPTMSRHYHHQADSNELLPINGKQEKRRHRHHQQQRPAEHRAPNDSQEQNKHRRKHNKHQEQSQASQRPRHRQHKIKDHMQNNTTTAMTAPVANLTLLTSTTSSSSASATSSASSTSPPTLTPGSAIDKHLNVVNHGSNFATSLLSPSSSASQQAAPTAIQRSTQLLSGGVVDTMPDNSQNNNNSNDDKQDHDRKHSSIGMATIIANVQQQNPQNAVSGSGSTSSQAAFNTNHDMTTFLDGVSDQYNLHGFPNQQYSIMHSEHFHGGHPVCGTDGRTYNTECQLKKRACRTNNNNLQVAYRGYCKSSCMGVKCLHGLTCVEDSYHIPHCITCNIQCPHDSETTMDNELHLKNYNKIMTLMQGTSKGNNHVFRDEESRSEAVCGVDGKTYKSVCDINRMICKIGRAIGVAYPGPCRADVRSCQDINCGPKNTCLVDYLTHQPRCISCRYKCSRKRRPMSLRFEEGKLCGVNNHTYNSWCEMRKDSCSTGYFIDVRTTGECGIA